jgi:Iap family predicted aminopeptidase
VYVNCPQNVYTAWSAVLSCPLQLMRKYVQYEGTDTKLAVFCARNGAHFVRQNQHSIFCQLCICVGGRILG